VIAPNKKCGDHPRQSANTLLGIDHDVLEMQDRGSRTTLNPENFDLHYMLKSLEEIFALRADVKKCSAPPGWELSPEVPPFVRLMRQAASGA